MIEAAVLGIIQGLTEFLPISSSGHLLLAAKLTNLPEYGLSFDAFLHLGTLFAVLFYFRQDYFAIFKSIFNPQDTNNRHLLLLIFIGILPAALVGIFFKDYIAGNFRQPQLVIFNLIFWGIVLGIADWYISCRTNIIKNEKQIKKRHSFIIGLVQVISLLPGTSRSGITITAGLFQSISRKAAARFSFIMSAPLIAGAGLISFKDILADPQGLEWGILTAGFFFSLLSGWLAIFLLLRLLEKTHLRWFMWYRVLLGLGLWLII